MKRWIVFVGLCGKNGKEIKGRGYRRQPVEMEPVSATKWESTSPILFVAKGPWPEVRTWRAFSHVVRGKALIPRTGFFGRIATLKPGDTITIPKVPMEMIFPEP